jgi:itaconate CoA-transferase
VTATGTGRRPFLDDVTVVACEQAVAAPLATRHLADLGARVIKIERPGTGDFARHYDQAVRGMSSHFVWLNRGKQSFTADLKTERGQELVTALVAQADVFVQNLGPGATDRLGFGGKTLSRAHPGLVICEISGYGASGPWRARKAYDLLIQAEAGLLGVTGTADQPAKVGIAAADISAGMYAFSGILAALFERERTGQGAVIEISLLDSLAEWMGYPYYYARYSGSPPPRTGASHATIAPYGPFTTADGESLLLAVQNDREWLSFCTLVISRTELVDDPRLLTNSLRVANRDLTDGVVGDAIRTLVLTEVISRCERARIAYGRMNDISMLEHHPQLTARHRWTAVDSPVGQIASLLPPIIASDQQPDLGSVPAIGEHTELILRELGYNSSDIADLRKNGVI